MSMLSVQDLRVALGGRTVLEHIGFEAGAGELIGLIGPNGAGKTTLLKAIPGLVGSSGMLSLDGRDIRGLSARDKARAIAYLPQEREVAWAISAHMLVSLGRSALKPAFAGLDRADETAIHAAMRRMDVARFADRPVTTLSGGERARVLIARVLAQDTPVILADEPVAGLDPAHQIGLMEGLGLLAREGRLIVVSLHELGLAAQFCTRLILLDKGRIVEEGTHDALVRMPGGIYRRLFERQALELTKGLAV